MVEALTYYGHREKLRLVNREGDLERLNTEALRIAKEVADQTGTLFAGNVCNCTIGPIPAFRGFFLLLDPPLSHPANIWERNDQAQELTDTVSEDLACLLWPGWLAGSLCVILILQVRGMFSEQVKLAKEAGVDFVIAETFGFLGEALVANEVIKREFNLPSVVTLVIHQDGKTRDGYSPEDALTALEVRPSEHDLAAVYSSLLLMEFLILPDAIQKAGADVVGFNCYRGPATMLPLIERVSKIIKTPLAALPVPYRTTEKEPTFFCLTDDQVGVFFLLCIC